MSEDSEKAKIEQPKQDQSGSGSAEKKPTRTQLCLDGARKQGGGLGMGISVILTWISSQYLGVEPPPEVISAASGLITGIGSWIQRNAV